MNTIPSFPGSPTIPHHNFVSHALPAPVPLKELLKQHWLDALEVRELLKISRGTLHNLCRKGLLPYSRIGGRLYFEATDIEAMLKNARQGSAKKD